MFAQLFGNKKECIKTDGGLDETMLVFLVSTTAQVISTEKFRLLNIQKEFIINL